MLSRFAWLEFRESVYIVCCLLFIVLWFGCFVASNWGWFLVMISYSEFGRGKDKNQSWLIRKINQIIQQNYKEIIWSKSIERKLIYTWISKSSKQVTTGLTSLAKVKMFTKSFVPNVSSIVLTTCFAISSLCPNIEPDPSIRITISFGLVAASMYQDRSRQSYRSTGTSLFHFDAGNWRIKPVELPKNCHDNVGSFL